MTTPHPANVVHLHENPRLAAALAYASIGWKVIPCWWIETDANGTRHCACGSDDPKHSAGKHPIGRAAPWGQNSASTEVELIKRWWGEYPQANIGVYLQESGLCAVDIDPRNGGYETMELLEAEHGSLYSDVLQYSGGGGEHRIFQRPEGNGSLPGGLGKGVDLKLNGYIIVAPSNHMSGGVYDWEASSDPRDGVLASPLPDWLRDISRQRAAAEPVDPGAPGRPVLVTPEQKQEIAEALQAVSSDSRDTWLQVGMALQSTGDPQWAYDTWKEWSMQSTKFDPVDQTRVWRSFKARGLDGVTYRTIFDLAKQAGVVVRPIAHLPEPVEEGDLAASGLRVSQPEPEQEPDNDLLRPPGMLGVATDWINATSFQPQPEFAVQAALAFASVAFGRRFVTTRRNWTPLYYLNIGKSGSGKEYAKKAVETLLEACGLERLIGPSGYTSDSGVLSALHDRPNHLSVIDEFHRVLESASVRNNTNAQGMMKMLIEAWGRCDGTIRPRGFSTFGMTREQKENAAKRSIKNPSLTILSMAVPEFWETIGSAAARDGFLNRFLIVETSIGRKPKSFVDRGPVPAAIAEWATETRARYDALIDPDLVPDADAAPVVVEFSAAAARRFSEFDAECIGLMDQYDADGLAEMFGRTNEQAMKLALVVALSCGHSQIQEADADWAIRYARHHALHAVKRLKECVADSEFEATGKQVVGVLRKAGAHGLSPRELYQRSRRFRSMSHRQQVDMFMTLRANGLAVEITTPPPSGRGKPRVAWVAVDVDTSASDSEGKD